MMRDGGLNVGGEQSGHMILSDYATTGDGLIAALQVLAVIVQSKRRASELCRRFRADAAAAAQCPLQRRRAARRAQGQGRHPRRRDPLGAKGRVLVRKSGTEPLIRVMVEGEDQGLIGQIADGIIREIQRVA